MPFLLGSPLLLCIVFLLSGSKAHQSGDELVQPVFNPLFLGVTPRFSATIGPVRIGVGNVQRQAARGNPFRIEPAVAKLIVAVQVMVVRLLSLRIEGLADVETHANIKNLNGWT